MLVVAAVLAVVVEVLEFCKQGSEIAGVVRRSAVGPVCVTVLGGGCDTILIGAEFNAVVEIGGVFCEIVVASIIPGASRSASRVVFSIEVRIAASIDDMRFDRMSPICVWRACIECQSAPRLSDEIVGLVAGAGCEANTAGRADVVSSGGKLDAKFGAAGDACGAGTVENASG